MTPSKSPKFAAFDIDGTLVRWQLYHAVADALAQKGYIDAGQYDTIRKARMLWKQRTHSESFKQYESELVKAYRKILTKLTVQQLQVATHEAFNEYKDQVYTYTRDLIKDLKRQGYLLFAISGSQAQIVAQIAKYYGFDDYIGTTYEQVNDRFTGKTTVALGKKHLVLDELVKKHHASYSGSIAVGDSLGDTSMLRAVEKPIAFNPERRLLNLAKEQGWDIVIERKNVIYKLKGSHGTYLLV